jgi:hypothetical protein
VRRQVGRGLDVGVRQRETVANEVDELREDALDGLGSGPFPVDQDLVPLRPDTDAEERFEVLQIFVIRAEKRRHALGVVSRDGQSSHYPLTMPPL